MCHILDIQLLTVGDGVGGTVSVPYEKYRALFNEVTTLQTTLRQEKISCCTWSNSILLLY